MKTKEKVQLLVDEKEEADVEVEKIKTAKANKKKAAQGGGSMADLEKMILAKRENGFGGFMNYMTDKYGDADGGEVIEMGPKKKKNKKRPLEYLD